MTIQLRVSHVERAGKHASRRHHLVLSSLLAPQNVVLTVDQNKRQLIDVTCKHIVEKRGQMEKQRDTSS